MKLRKMAMKSFIHGPKTQKDKAQDLVTIDVSEVRFDETLVQMRTNPKQGVKKLALTPVAKLGKITIGRSSDPNLDRVVLDGIKTVWAVKQKEDLTGEKFPLKGEFVEIKSSEHAYVERVRINMIFGEQFTSSEKLRIIGNLTKYGMKPDEIGELIKEKPEKIFEKIKMLECLENILSKLSHPKAPRERRQLM